MSMNDSWPSYPSRRSRFEYCQGDRAVLLGPHRDGQHHVRPGRRLGEEQVGDDEEVERVEPVGDPARVGSGHADVRREQQQRPHPAGGAESAQHLGGGHPRPRQARRVDAPHSRDVGAVRAVGELAVPGQLVGLLPVLAPALPVALTGERPVPRTRAPRQPERERQVDERLRGRRPRRVLLGAPCRHHHRGGRRPQQLRDRLQVTRGDARDPLHPVRPVPGHRLADRLEPHRPRRDVLLVHPAPAHHQVQQTVGQGGVGAGARLQVQVRRARRGRGARVDDHVPGTALAAGFQVLDERRHGLGRVRADQEQDVGQGQVRDGERQPAVDPERAGGGGRGRRHAPAAVVVDRARPQHRPGELAQQVRLLVGQAAAAEAPDRVAAVPPLRRPDGRGDGVERLVPRRLPQRRGAVTGEGPHERGREPLGVREQVGRRPALGAQSASVRREVRRGQPHVGSLVPRAARHVELHAALQRAVRAVRRHRPDRFGARHGRRRRELRPHRSMVWCSGYARSAAA
ncbi:hypothetical protein Cfla_0406 [Cellulomonas flavigena DSM 20109]|uniref:Uncharacterized protein n=1 Tax=Cellulomonas flavigena (strain ATCC 482 / DSM 20109 / BCRC 11376 / JCM 18109 / NBRC 3775 / NCIMB 8073 / NRS 134) TaxID=446466 RepID=D5UHP9_CELFN|nr:hypothetical protein Cfla_0406 [Cellulomonas flavigena DSM 20109]